MAQEIADSTLLDTWGSSGAKIEPDISKIIEGWQLGEQPPHEYMNWLQNTFGSKLNHILKNGVAKWNNKTEYLAGATTQHNGSVWKCKTTNTNSEPTDSNSNWDKMPSLESLALTVDTINDFPTSATTGDTCIVKDLDRGGIFIYDSTKVAEDNQGTNFNGWVRQFSGAVNVKWFGAKGDGITDDTIAINNVLDNFLNVEINYNTFAVSLPLNIRSGHNIVGNGTIKIISSSPSILRNNTGTTVSGVTIRDITFDGNNLATKGFDLGIFCLSYLENISIYNVVNIGFSASDLWQCNLSGVVCRNTGAMGAKGFEILDGTSTSFNRCWSKNFAKGYDLGTLKYSNITAGACDNFTDYAYGNGQSITYTACGAEGGILGADGCVFLLGSREYNILGGQLLNISSSQPNGNTCIFRCVGSLATIIGFRAENAISGTNINGINASDSARVEVKSSLLTTLNLLAEVSGSYTRVSINDGSSYTVYGGAIELNNMPKVGGSEIVSSGTNVNGTYTKFADGTLICKHRILNIGDCTYPTSDLGLSGYTTQSPISWTFPFAFADLPACSFSAIRSDRTTSIFFKNSYETTSAFNGISVLCSTSMVAAFSPIVECIAIGKWK